jgi:hypothetical protein
MPEHDAKLIERAEIYENAALDHWQWAKEEKTFLTRHCFELQAKKFEWEAEQLRKLL